MLRLAVLVFAVSACDLLSSADDVQLDAGFNGADATPECEELEFEAGPQLSGGASVQLHGAGAGAWLSHSASHLAPGEILYIEAYRDLFTGLSYSQSEFASWIDGCAVCVFLATGCARYELPANQTDTPIAPLSCDALYLLERGLVTLRTFETNVPSGQLAGMLEPLGLDERSRFVEVYAQGDPVDESGYGRRVPDGRCVEVPIVQFDGRW